MAELGGCSPKIKPNANNSKPTVTSNSTTTASEGGPLALTYDKINSNDKINNDDTQNDSSNQNNSSSNGQALLPTPGNSNSDKPKTVTWIQKQGTWKQIVQDAPESDSTNVQTTIATTASTAVSPTDSSTNSLQTNFSSDPLTLSYYNIYLQQALSLGQDYPTAMATAQYYAAYYAAAAAATSTAETDNSNTSPSKYTAQSYNNVPPVDQSSNSTAHANSSTISSSYGYGVLPSTLSNQTAPTSNYYAAYYGLGSTTDINQPPPPPE